MNYTVGPRHPRNGHNIWSSKDLSVQEFVTESNDVVKLTLGPEVVHTCYGSIY